LAAAAFGAAAIVHAQQAGVPPSPTPADLPDYVGAMVTPPPEALGLDPFYRKYADAFGIPIVGSEKVPAAALLVARDIVNYMLLARPDLRAALVARGSRVMIMAQAEGQMDLPEYRDWTKPAKDDRRLTPRERENYDLPGGIASMTDAGYWNRRARGMGGVRTSCAEENLLGYPGTRYYGEHICVHEFSHGVMSAIRAVDAPLMTEIQAAYDHAKASGRFKGHYAENTVAEYWAEGTQWWFWSNYEWMDGEKRLQSPTDLQEYDPTLFALLGRVYASHHIPADVYYGRNVTPRR
jgi:hypothetical protein